MTGVVVILLYLGVLIALGVVSNRYFRGTSRDYFVASNSIGPFLLLMSVFGTTMTAFALVGSTGKAYERGIGVYGLMASWSALIHAAVFFLIGIRVWALAKKYGYVTQIQFFRDRFQSRNIGFLLFPILVGLVIPYLLIGIIGAGKVVQPVTAGAFPGLFPHANPVLDGGVPPWLTGMVICAVVLSYVFMGGSRGAAWANTLQTLVFMVVGIVSFVLIAKGLGGFAEASRNASEAHLVRTVHDITLQGNGGVIHREVGIPPLMFLSYCFVPLSVGMFPHLFQHWLTAKSADSFKLTVVAHPLCIMVVWVPCVLVGMWASGVLNRPPERVNAVLGIMVSRLVESPLVSGLLTAGILAAIMSSLDSQFLCLGTIFTNDIVIDVVGRQRFNDRQIVLLARAFIVAIVIVSYVISLVAPRNIFDLAVWCFSGFGSLFPLVFAAVHWRRVTKAGAYASILAAAVVWFCFFRASGYGGEYTVLGGVMPVTFSFAASAIALVVVSLVTKAPDEAHVRRFIRAKQR